MTKTKTFDNEVNENHCACGGALIGVRARDGQWRIHCRKCGKATTGHRSKNAALQAWEDGRTA